MSPKPASDPIVRLDGWMHGYDHILTVVSATLLQSGELGDNTITEAVYKKGAAIPVLLASGQEGFLLGAMIPVTFGVTLLASLWLAKELLPRASRLEVAAIWLFAMSIWASAPMFWGFAFYQHGHIMVTLCVTVMSIVLARMTSGQHTPRSYYVVFVVASFVVALARFEGVLIALIVAVAFVCTEVDLPTWRNRFSLRLIAVFTPVSGFLLWIASFGNFPVADISPGFVAGALVSAGILLVLVTSFSATLRQIVFVVTGSVLVGSGVIFLVRYQSGWSGRSFLENMFTESGAWGITSWLILVAAMVVVTSRQKPQNMMALWLLFSLLAFSALGKYLDSFGTGGGIRAGWGDSVNRSVFHVFAPAFAVSVLALYEASHVVRNVLQYVRSGRLSKFKAGDVVGR